MRWDYFAISYVFTTGCSGLSGIWYAEKLLCMLLAASCEGAIKVALTFNVLKDASDVKVTGTKIDDLARASRLSGKAENDLKNVHELVCYN